MNLIRSIVNILKPRKTNATFIQDTTLYRIETDPHEYEGSIIYQNDAVIKIKKRADFKPVKILKLNIKRITIIRVE